MCKQILFLTTMYPNNLRRGTKVCHYFTYQWKKMGYNVLVVNYRSMFPPIYTTVAGWFPKLAEKIVKNDVEMDRNMDCVYHEEDGIPVYSTPIFKYIPHGKYPKISINKKLKELRIIMKERDFEPDMIIGHFYNPQLELIGRLKQYYPYAKTCVVFHELNMSIIRNNYKNNMDSLMAGIDIVGYRSHPIKQMFENEFGRHKSFMCFSGVSQSYLTTPQTRARSFNNGPLNRFIYVGQFIERKYPGKVIEALNHVYGDNDYHLDYIGKFEFVYPAVEKYVEDNNLAEKVSFKGQVPRDEIISYYDNADCFIMISKWEVFGLVYLEAMSRGCITIAARNEGMQGIIEDGVNGFLCEAGNSAELANIIERINKMTADEKKRISDAGRITAKELSDYNVAKTYIEAVENCK